MRRRVFFILLFVCCLIAGDRAIGRLLRGAFNRIRTGEAGGQINAALQHVDSDVVVFGSSLARHHVDPRVFQEKLKWQAFNAGCNGQGISYARMLESLMLERGCRGKLFIYVVNWSDLFHDDLSRGRMFAIFADESSVVSEILGGSSWVDRAKLQSHAYRFNTLAVSIGRRTLLPGHNGINGFHPIDVDYISNPRDAAEMSADRQATLGPYDVLLFAKKLRRYAEFLQAARERSIPVLFVVGPTYREGLTAGFRERYALARLQRIAEEGGARFLRLDETTVPEFQDRKYFGDPRHLNARGARLFTEHLVSQSGRPAAKCER